MDWRYINSTQLHLRSGVNDKFEPGINLLDRTAQYHFSEMLLCGAFLHLAHFYLEEKFSFQLSYGLVSINSSSNSPSPGSVSVRELKSKLWTLAFYWSVTSKSKPRNIDFQFVIRRRGKIKNFFWWWIVLYEKYAINKTTTTKQQQPNNNKTL